MSVGGEAVFALRVSNTGDAPGQDVVVRDTLPAGLTPVAASADCTISGQEVVCRIDELEAGDQRTFAVRARAERAAAGQTLTNRGTVTAVVPDPEPANDASEAAVTIGTAIRRLLLSSEARARPGRHRMPLQAASHDQAP